MIIVAWIGVLLGALIYFLVFVWETILFRRPGVHQGIFAVPSRDVEPVRLWSFCVGLYNLFLSLGAVAGVILWATGSVAEGRTLVIFTGLFMFGCGVVLFVADRLALSRPKGPGVAPSIACCLPTAVATLAALAAP